MVARIRSFPPAVVSYSPSNALAALVDELLQSGSFRNFCSFSLQRPRSAPTTPRPIIQKLPRVRGRNSVGKPPTSLAHAPQSFRPRHREVLKWGQVRYHLIPRPTTLAYRVQCDLIGPGAIFEKCRFCHKISANDPDSPQLRYITQNRKQRPALISQFQHPQEPDPGSPLSKPPSQDQHNTSTDYPISPLLISPSSNHQLSDDHHP